MRQMQESSGAGAEKAKMELAIMYRKQATCDPGTIGGGRALFTRGLREAEAANQ
jgi:hypothetical protein